MFHLVEAGNSGEYSYNIDQKGQSKVLDPLRHFDGNREF